jgi:hypothetical protein
MTVAMGTGGSNMRRVGHRVGLAEELPDEVLELVRHSEMDSRHDHLNAELKDWSPSRPIGDGCVGSPETKERAPRPALQSHTSCERPHPPFGHLPPRGGRDSAEESSSAPGRPAPSP